MMANLGAFANSQLHFPRGSNERVKLMSKQLTIKLVEEQCAGYESACRQGRLDGLRSFLLGASETVPLELANSLANELAYELCRISIYYRCQQSQLGAGGTIAPLRQLCPEIQDPAMILGLIRTEFQCRLALDRSANLDEYLLQFPDLATALRRTLTDEVLNRSPIRVRVMNDERTTFSTFLRRTILFGRQNREDSEPPAIRELADGSQRLVVASRYESRVSRRHAIVSAYAPNLVKVTAISGKSATFTDKDRLQGGEARICRVPFILHIGPQEVVVEPVHSN